MNTPIHNVPVPIGPTINYFNDPLLIYISYGSEVFVISSNSNSFSYSLR